MACTFFFVYFLVAVSRTYSQFTGGQNSTSKFETVMLRAADTLAFAPMLSVPRALLIEGSMYGSFGSLFSAVSTSIVASKFCAASILDLQH